MSELAGSYRELQVWQKAMELVDAVYDVSLRFPEEERFVLTPQIRRAAISIPSNIAEGHGRMSRGDYLRFCRVANGSLKEVETQLIIAGRRGYIEKPEAAPVWSLLQEIGRMLFGLMRSLS